ncbi:hypothetical protein DFP72DRAFT_1076574 [Ephemerocybe angulata]|uniref:Uncharacterized protein n=1 Tax=Ephemerocybe angulata TaxID=980116 RepID=A0A8H6HFP5_9AGAR|nr:hypothetical protein DFP72DRAFT_1076574 [Tulosesus angulatus]
MPLDVDTGDSKYGSVPLRNRMNLDAREPAAIEVPFHPSIRDFLDAAVILYRRDSKKPEPKPQPKKIASITFHIEPPVLSPDKNKLKDLIVKEVDVYEGATGRTIKESIRQRVRKIGYYPELIDGIELRVGKKKEDAKVLGDDVLLTTAVRLSSDIKFWVTEKNWKQTPLPPGPEHWQVARKVKFAIASGRVSKEKIEDEVEVQPGDTGGVIMANIRYQVKALKKLVLPERITLKVGEVGGKYKAKVLNDKELFKTAVLQLREPITFWVE